MWASCCSDSNFSIQLASHFCWVAIGLGLKFESLPFFNLAMVEGETLLQQLTETAARNFGDKIAIQSEGKTGTGFVASSYDDFHVLVLRVASALVASGVEKMDRVAWLMPNCLEAVALTCACYRIGAISVPINVRYAAPEVEYMVDKVKAKILFLTAQKMNILEEFLQIPRPVVAIRVPSGDPATVWVGHETWESFLQLEGDGKNLVRPCAPEDPALILFTSGTTGFPKGVLHSHGSCWAAITNSAEALGLQSDDVVLVGKPITHAGGLQTQLLPTLMKGGQAVLAMIPSPTQAVELIQTFGVTVYAMLASSLLDFVENLERNDAPNLSLRRVIGSGDSVPLKLQSRFLELFGWPVLEGCGITEIGCYYATQPLEGGKLGSIGLPTPGTRLRLVEDGKDVPLGCAGEVLIKTPSLPLGYWEDLDATVSLFQDGWMRTGDLARQDEDGFIWFVGRRKLIIIRRGSNIAPAAVERVLANHPKVHSSVVVGVPDELDGEVPVAWIVPKQELPTEAELENYVSKHLAAHEMPLRYWLRTEMPLNSVGKFDRVSLQKEASSKPNRLTNAQWGGA